MGFKGIHPTFYAIRQVFSRSRVETRQNVPDLIGGQRIMGGFGRRFLVMELHFVMPCLRSLASVRHEREISREADAVRNCTTDEGKAPRDRLTEAGLKSPSAAVVKSHGREHRRKRSG